MKKKCNDCAKTKWKASLGITGARFKYACAFEPPYAKARGDRGKPALGAVKGRWGFIFVGTVPSFLSISL